MLFLAVVFFCRVAVAWAAEKTVGSEEEIEIHLLADKLFYNEETGLVTAQGQVQVDLEDAKIKADDLKLDTKEDILNVVGHVQLDVKGQSLDKPWQAESATYWIKDKIIAADSFAAEITDPQVKGTIFIRGKSGRDEKTQLVGTEGSLTTCDYDEPHYYFSAEEFTYLPHDKLIGKQVSFYALGKKRWTIPYYVFNFKQDRSKPFPTFGYSEVEGAFMKGAFDYVINQNNTGLLLIDVMQKKGMGIGFDHEFVVSDKPENKGKLSLYYLREKDTALNDWIIKLSHRQNIWPSLTTDLSYNSTNTYRLTGGRRDEKQANVLIDWRSEGSSNNLRLGWQASSASSWAYFQQAALTHQSKLPLDLDLGFLVNWQRWPEIGVPKQKADLEYLKLGSSLGWGSWQLNLKKRLIIPANSFSSWWEKWPELQVDTNYFPLAGIDWKLMASAGIYEEHTYYSFFESLRRTTRYVTGGQAKKSLVLRGGERVDLGANLRQYNYDTGDAAYSEGQSAVWDSGAQKFFGPLVSFSNNLLWQRQNFYGGSPLILMDRQASYAQIKNTFSLFDPGQKYKLRLSTGYDLQNNYPQDIILDSRVVPSDNLELTAASGYSPRQKIWNDLVVRGSYAGLWPEGKISLGARYSLIRGELTSLDTVLEYGWGGRWEDRWSIKLEHSYQARLGSNLKRIALTKDLHCWEAEISYDNVAHVIMFRLGIKAFPGQGMEVKS